jgi:hypothetical protein
MGVEQLDYNLILADLENKKAALEATIATFRAALASGALGQPGEVPPSPNGIGSTPSISGGEVPAGAFLGKSIPDAAKLYLAIVKKKQTSREIADALKRGGMESTSKNLYGNVHSILDRARKAGTYGIVKMGRSYWGLADWYPASLRSTVAPEKRSGKKKGIRKKGKSASKAGEAKGKPLTIADAHDRPEEQLTGFGRILQLLRSRPDHEFSPAEVGQALGYRSNLASMLLGRLLSTEKIEKNKSNGTFRMAGQKHVAVGD